MNRWMKKCAVCSMAIITIITMSGCTSKNVDKEKKVSQIIPSGGYAVSGDKLSLDTTIETTPEKVDEIVVTPYEIDVEKCKNRFLKDPKKEDVDVPGFEGYQDDEGVFRPIYDGRRKPVGFSFYANFSVYVENCFRLDPRDDIYNADKYMTNRDFDFMSKEQALEYILNQLKELGIDLGEIEYRCYSLDYETLKQEEYAMDMEGNEDPSYYKESWTEEDNCYYFTIRQKYKNIIEYHKYHSMRNYEDCNSSIQVLISKDGIKKLDLTRAFQIKTTGKKIQILNPQEILNQLSDKYGKVITQDSYVIDSFNLCYYSDIYEGNPEDLETEYSVTPIYQCHMIQTYELGTRVEQLLIDATTGKELQ